MCDERVRPNLPPARNPTHLEQTLGSPMSPRYQDIKQTSGHEGNWTHTLYRWGGGLLLWKYHLKWWQSCCSNMSQPMFRLDIYQQPLVSSPEAVRFPALYLIPSPYHQADQLVRVAATFVQRRRTDSTLENICTLTCAPATLSFLSPSLSLRFGVVFQTKWCVQPR